MENLVNSIGVVNPGNYEHSLFACALSNGLVVMVDVDSGEKICELQAHSRTINQLVCHPTIPLIATCSDDTFINLWYLEFEEKDLKDVHLKLT